MRELSHYVAAFHQHLERRYLSPHTVRNYVADVLDLERAYAARGATLLELTVDDVTQYMAGLKIHLEPTSRGRRLSGIRAFYRFLVRHQVVPFSPAKLAPRPLIPRKEREVPSVAEVLSLLQLPSTASATGLRDRAMLELFYGAGIRNAELTGLNLDKVNSAERMVRVMGKGRRERLCPINPHAVRALAAYLSRRGELRSKRWGTQDGDALFLGRYGGRLGGTQVWRIVKRYARAQGLDCFSPHTIRHCYATHLLHNGARVEQVQELLGHDDLRSTQRYTHVTLEFLQGVLRASHPREVAATALEGGTGSNSAPLDALHTPSARSAGMSARQRPRRGSPTRSGGGSTSPTALPRVQAQCAETVDSPFSAT